MTKRRYSRWVSIGKHDLIELVEIARAQGMECILAFKPSMHYWNEIALFGTSVQMGTAENVWLRHGHEVKHKKPPGAFGINRDSPRWQWAEISIVMRREHGCYRKSCPECDERLRASEAASKAALAGIL